MELILTGSTSAVLQRTHESVTMLRHIVCTVVTEVKEYRCLPSQKDLSVDAEIVHSFK